MREPQDIFLDNVSYVSTWLTERNNWLHNFFNAGLEGYNVPDGYDPWQTVYNHFNAQQNRIQMIMNGEELQFYSWPILMNWASLVPMSEVLRIFPNADVYYTAGRQYFLLKGEPVTLMLPTGVLGNDVYLPIRDIAYSLGYSIWWDQEAETIVIGHSGG
jgi:hypothetical protein